jgi:hypothetical protein
VYILPLCARYNPSFYYYILYLCFHLVAYVGTLRLLNRRLSQARPRRFTYRTGGRAPLRRRFLFVRPEPTPRRSRKAVLVEALLRVRVGGGSGNWPPASSSSKIHVPGGTISTSLVITYSLALTAGRPDAT